MSLLKRINTKASTAENTGFGTNAAAYGGRFLNQDGSANILKKGVGLLEGVSLYHVLLKMPRIKFILVLFSTYLIINIFFTITYLLVGIHQLSGIMADTWWQKAEHAFFFSCQTFTTVGYGSIYPKGTAANFIACIEAFTGWLGFALAAGLMYGRFSQPKAYLKFTDRAVIAPHKEGKALMFRVAPYKNTVLSDAQARITLALSVEEDGRTVNRFFPLELEIGQVLTLTLSWTIVHPITEKSPLYNFTKEDFEKTKLEILVFISAFDEHFSNTVLARTSYMNHEIVHGARFAPMFYRSENNVHTILDFDRLNAVEEAVLG